METAEAVVKDILQEILVQASEQPVKAVDFQFVVRYMNRYMNRLAVTVPLGYTEVSEPTDLITIPDGAVEGLIFNVAMRVAPSYDVTVTPSMREDAKEGLEAVRKLARNTVATKHPSTLPIGSGNQDCGDDSRFYAGEDTTVLTETNGNILLEDITNE